MNTTTDTARPWITPVLVTALAAAVPPHAVLVWLYLWARADKSTARAWPATKTIATDLRACRNRVMRSLGALEHAGWLQVSRAPGTRSEYVVIAPRLVACEIGHPQEAGVRNEAGVACEIGHPPACEIGPASEPYQKNTTRNTTRKRTRDACAVTIPPSLESESFQTAWGEWVAYRTRRRLSKDPACLNKQLAMLADLGADGAIQSIEASIRNGWQGLFPAKDHCNGNHKRGFHDGPGQRYVPGAERIDPHVGKW